MQIKDSKDYLVAIILYDVLSSPILIVVRLVRYIFNKFFKKFLVKGIKKIIVMLKGKNAR